MLYQCEHSRIVVDERQWYIKTREQQQADLGMTKHVYYGAFNLLQELEFVQVAYTTDLLSDPGVRRTMFTVTDKARAAVIEAGQFQNHTFRKSEGLCPKTGRSHSGFRNPLFI
jgi:hypothetical protein